MITSTVYRIFDCILKSLDLLIVGLFEFFDILS
jgi:hypothetical protein